MRHLRRSIVFLAPVLWVAGCAGTHKPCVQAGECGDKHACVAGVCRRSTEAPVPVASRRLLLDPVQLAVVTSRADGESDATDIPFGCDAAGQVVLLLRFEAPFSPDSDIRSAYLVLKPVADVAPSAAPVPLSIARIVSPWAAAETSWARLPRLSSVETTWMASTWGQRPLRIDVTSIVRRWREHRSDDQGLAVLASPQDAFGARYALGTGRGRGPRLDIYLR